MEKDRIFEEIVSRLQLGTLKALPQRVSGGYMHKVYRLETTKGSYAVKILNSEIMKRPDALKNFQRAEYLEKILQENEIPIIPALEVKGEKMHSIENQYFYLFEWFSGKVLGWREITAKHCNRISRILAQIHKIKHDHNQTFIAKPVYINWDHYIEQIHSRCPELEEELKRRQELLYFAQDEFNDSLKKLPPVTCICDGDMDSKNVLWANGCPKIIDLECLDYGNPFFEMFQLALSWSGSVICQMDYECLTAFLTSYQHEYGNFNADWNAFYGIGFTWIEWLEYNIKRALMIECANEEERCLGIEQVHETIQRIEYHNSIKAELLHQLEKL